MLAVVECVWPITPVLEGEERVGSLGLLMPILLHVFLETLSQEHEEESDRKIPHILY